MYQNVSAPQNPCDTWEREFRLLKFQTGTENGVGVGTKTINLLVLLCFVLAAFLETSLTTG